MQPTLACLALLLAACLGGAGASPIDKVVKLFQEMLDKSKKNTKKDEELFGKFKEYCDTNTEEKTNSILDLTKDIAMLENKIAALQGCTGSLSVKCSELRSCMEENEATRKAAEDIRQKAKVSRRRRRTWRRPAPR